MHVAHILLVQADSAEDAFERVESELSPTDYGVRPEWSDWHNANNSAEMNFAGRWTGSFFKSDKEDEPNPNHLCYADDKALAESVISDQLAMRDAEIANIRKNMVSDLSTVTINHYAEKWNMDYWYTQKFLKLADNEWTPDSYIYDLETSTASLHWFMERVMLVPKKQFLVPVDFHY
jgi:hypothetical protein